MIDFYSTTSLLYFTDISLLSITIMLRSKAVLLGSEANKKAQSGHHYNAIQLFSKAIHLFPFDYRFYLNRAFCYEKTELYHLALADAEEAIRHNPSIQKCYFRKAKALTGLREYTKAEQTFKYILQMNPCCQETKDELIKMRCYALIDMGFDKLTSIKASNTYNSIRDAIDGLLSQKVSNNHLQSFSESNDEINKNGIKLTLNESNNNKISNSLKFLNGKSNHLNDNIEYESQALESGERYADKARNWAQSAEKLKIVSKAHNLLKPTNIWGYNGLRVENVNIHNKKALIKRFSAFGKLKGIEPVKNSKTSVWIYYDNPLSPVEAIAHLQSSINCDINYCYKGSPLPLRMFFAPTNDQTELKFSRPKQPQDNKGECYYWRTTSCSLDDKCPLLHIPANKHIDAQVWMKTKDGKPI